MPRPSIRSDAFDPEALDVLASAFDGAWSSLVCAGQLNGDAEPVRSELAKHVIQLARQGERDRQRLIHGALRGFRRNQSGVDEILARVHRQGLLQHPNAQATATEGKRF